MKVEQVFGNANCSDHPLKVDSSLLEGSETLLALGSCNCFEPNAEYKTCESYCDSGSFALAKLADGRYLTVRESSDTSGHGCQCDGSADVYETLQEAISLGLTDAEREHYRKAITE